MKLFFYILLINFVVIFALVNDARGHTVTRPTVDCRNIALRDARRVLPATKSEFNIIYNKCIHFVCKRPNITPKPTTVKYVRATMRQRSNIARSIAVGVKMKATPKMIDSMVSAITVESRALNLPYGHSSSVGILQLLNIHGSEQWRMVIENSVGWYFRSAFKLNTSNMSAAEIAAAVQRPADGSVYRVYMNEARHTSRLYLHDWIVCLR